MRRVRVPIALVLALSFGALIAAAVAVVLLLMIRVAERNTTELLIDNGDAAVSAIAGSLRWRTDAASEQVAFIAELIESGEVRLDETQRLQDLLIGSLATVRELNAITVIRPDLYGIAAARGADGKLGLVDANEQLRDSSYRLMFRVGAAAAAPVWSSVGYAPLLGTSYLPLIAPIRRGDTLLAVVVVGLSLRELSQDLARGYAESRATPFVVTGDGRVIAHPLLDAHAAALSPDKPLLSQAEIGDPVLAGFRADPAEVDEFHRQFPRARFSAQRVDIDGDTHLLLYLPMTGFGPQPWYAGVYYDEDEIALTLARISQAGAAGMAVLLVAIVLAILLGRMLSRPIRRLADTSGAVGRLEFSDQPALPGSLFREIDIAARAYNTMVTGLRWLETYVPRSLVGLLLRQDQPLLQPRELLVTVMFTDIVGFSRVAQRLPAPQLADFLNRHFELLGQAIQASGGAIDKYIGDSVMAFWGAPEEQPDHAERGCRAALAAAAALARDNARRRTKQRPPVRIRIGIHTGLALAGNIGATGRINYTLVGDTVNVAQRLEQFGKTIDDGAADAIIVASADLVARLPDGIRREPLGAHHLPGRSEATELYRLVA